MIQLDAVSRRFGAQVLFRELSWRIPAGARLGLVGPNGAGKTTLLRLLAGRDKPDGGTVHRPRAFSVGYLPQEVEAVSDGNVLATTLAAATEVQSLRCELEAAAAALAASAEHGAATGPLAERYAGLRDRYELLDGDRLEVRAGTILSGLGIPPAWFERPLHELSGGWRMRVVLAGLLLTRPDLLLLDEPTNHLDLEAANWLESFLADYEGGYVVVAHDRYLLNRLARGIAELERGEVITYTGTYDDYLAARELRRDALEKAAAQQRRDRARTQLFIDRFRYKNTKARQVQAKIRALDKEAVIETETAAARIRFGFPEAPRSSDRVVVLEGVGKRYGGTTVYRDLDFLLRRGERLALVGPNGTGKSTLLKLVAGTERPDAGRVELGHNVVLHYYAQHQLEALDPGSSALEQLEEAAPAADRQRLRNLLGAFLFRGEDVDKRVAVLSGGEKARLALARMLVRPANLLLLDEPTNHLDLASREVLEHALREYAGTLVVVSHDRYFINRIASRVGEVRDGRLEAYEGDYDEWLAYNTRRTQADVGAIDESAPSAAAQRRRARRREAEQRNARYRRRQAIERRLAPLEARVEALEETRAALQRDQADPAVYSDPERARETAAALEKVETELAERYAEWERLAADGDDPA